MKRSSETIDRLTVKEITLESKNGSVTLSADNNDGKIRFEPLNKVQSGSFIVDLKNESITTENAFIKKINFYDGTYLDSAALISETIGIVNQGLKTIELKPNKIFFKYNGDDTPGAGQQIEIKVFKPSSLAGTPALTITPDNVGITLNQTAPDTYILTVAEFDKASADTIQIQATLTNTEGTFIDVLTIYKTRDGTDALVGGLSNPFLALQANSAGEVANLATILNNKAIGTFTVFKGSEELTNSGKVTYAVASVTDNLVASINPTTGIYAITNWSPDELVGEAIFTATDNITNQQVKGKFTIITSKQGEIGLTGNGARTVKLIADDQQIAYKANDDLLAPTSIQVTASQQNHVGTVYYEFIVYEGLSNVGITLYNGTNNNILLTNTNKNYGSATYTFIENTKTGYGKSKTLKVRTRENSPSAPIISSEDIINIIATKDGSDAFEIVFSNTNHSFPANSNGDVAAESYAGGGSIVEAYIGNEQLSPVSGIPGNGQFTVSVTEQQNITSGLIQPDPNSAIKRMNIGDPSNFISNKDSGSITYTITGKNSNGVSKTQLEKVSFTKSKQGQQGLPGSSGIDARAVELVSNVYQFNYNSSNTASPTGGFTLTASSKNTTGTVSFKFYKNNVLITTQTATTLARTDIPTANNSDSWKVEMLEDGTVKAIDTVSIYGTRDGGDAITLVVPNDNHTFTADNAGGSINFAGSGTTIKLLVGSTPLTATTSSPPSSGQFNASLSGVSGIALGSITVTATDTLTLGQATAFGSDSGTATLSVNFRRPGSTTTETVTRILTYSKSKQGTIGPDGPQGPDGVDAADELIYSFNRTKTVNSIIRPIGWLSVSADNSRHEQYQPITNYYSTIGRVVASGESIYGGNIFALEQSSGDFSAPRYIASPSVPIDPKKSYKVKVRFKWTTGLNTNSRIYFNNFNGNFVRTKQYYCDIDSVVASNNWVELNFYFSDSTTDVSTVSNIGTTTTVLPFYQNTAFFNFVIYTDSMSGGGSAYFDILSITEWTLNDKDTFWFTTDGKLRIGLNRSGTVRADDGNLFNYLSDTPDIQIIAGSTTSNIFDGGFPDINMTNPSYQSNILGKLSFNGANGVIYDNNSNGTLEFPPDQIEIAERSSIIVGQRSYSGLVGRPYIALYNAPPTGPSVYPAVTARALPQLNMFIENACVGIPSLPFASGVPDYTHRLYVDGKAHITGGIKTNLFDNTQGYTFIGGTSTAVAGALYVNRGSATSQITTTQDEFYIDAASGGTGLYLNGKIAKNVILGSSGLNANVGIGAFTPSVAPLYKLHVMTNENTEYVAKFQNSSSSGFGILISAGSGSSTRTLIQFRDKDEVIVGAITYSGNTTSYGSFTGEHPGYIIDLNDDYEYGNIVKIKNTISFEKYILYNVTKTSSSYDKKIMGVFGGLNTKDENSGSFGSGSYSIYSVGDGHILVCNQGGNIEIGDYICSSDIPGVGMKQNDDILHSYTVAKSTQNVNWQEVSSSTLLISCTYHAA